ncbi:hypothetical protein ACFFV7_15310 [Nonomuraea spiralis]|uniref:Proline-rich protein n=1 Tax=Nonomuraea spiralis TaxID=46182 RepID=A0ABV5IF71_9ACTN|nr:hypothetical protein [Nonomuraea spiralis]GGT18358.1 hypothetical protein GCM10010176_073700 [Nonomuraea spiralis]
MTTPEQYAQAVRDALADHPDREELIEDLDDHLAEIAAESDLPLEDRLGPPAAYADELVAAYGGRPQSRQKRRRRPREYAARAHAALLRQKPYQGLVAFLPELRPGWWVLRGYLLAMLLLAITARGGLVPGNLAEWALVAAAVWVSVWFGRAGGGRFAALLATGVNLVAALALLVGMAEASGGREQPVAMSAPADVMLVGGSLGFYNIKPYAKDGSPLTDVYLYDQDGNPITVAPEEHGFTVDRSCGEPVLNRYPLPLVQQEEMFADDGTSKATPSTCPTATPVPTGLPSAAPSGGPSAGPSGEPSATPVPSRTR